MEPTMTTIGFDHIPPALLRAGYEEERRSWQMQLAQLHARLRAQQHIAELLKHEDTARVDALVKDMELVATGLEMIEQLIMALPPAATNGASQSA